MSEEAKIVRTPLYPLYSDVKVCVKAWTGESSKTVSDMIGTIFSMTGTPQDPVDWTEPDHWIPKRLTGEDERLAKKLWVSSGKKTNPRHVYGCYLFINSMELLDRATGVYQLKERGQKFLDGDPELIRELDAAEGLPRVLSLVAQKTQAKRSDMLDD